jgi:hypothetical protein
MGNLRFRLELPLRYYEGDAPEPRGGCGGGPASAGKGGVTALKSEEAPKGLLDSPSRFRFRPPHRLTFGLHLVPPGMASSYSRSVLGARGNLETDDLLGKAAGTLSKPENVAICAHEVLHMSTTAVGPPVDRREGGSAALELDITRVIVRRPETRGRAS